MSDLRVLLVDDEPLALERVRAGFGRLSGATVIGAAGDGPEAVRLIADLRPDLVILDIQMPGMSGVAVAAGLEGDDRPEVIFVTAFDHYAPTAFEVEAVDYLLKPVKFERLRAAVDRARRRCDLRQNAGRVAELEHLLESYKAPKEAAPSASAAYDTELWAPNRDGLVRVPVASIDWIEAARDYVLLHTPVRSHMVRTTMGSLERRLDPRQMLRIHRSAFVRPEAISNVQRLGKGLYAIVLRDGSALQVGPTYTADLLAALNLDARRAGETR